MSQILLILITTLPGTSFLSRFYTHLPLTPTQNKEKHPENSLLYVCCLISLLREGGLDGLQQTCSTPSLPPAPSFVHTCLPVKRRESGRTSSRHFQKEQGQGRAGWHGRRGLGHARMPVSHFTSRPASLLPEQHKGKAPKSIFQRGFSFKWCFSAGSNVSNK